MEKRSVPARTVLFGEGLEVAGGVYALRQPDGVEAHESAECMGRRSRRKRMGEQQRRQPHCLAAEFGADG